MCCRKQFLDPLRALLCDSMQQMIRRDSWYINIICMAFEKLARRIPILLIITELYYLPHVVFSQIAGHVFSVSPTQPDADVPSLYEQPLVPETHTQNKLVMWKKVKTTVWTSLVTAALSYLCLIYLAAVNKIRKESSWRTKGRFKVEKKTRF